MRRPEAMEAAARQAFARSPSRDVVPTCGVTTGRRATFGSHDVGTTSREGARLDSTARARVRRRHASPGVGGSCRAPSLRSLALVHVAALLRASRSRRAQNTVRYTLHLGRA